MVLHKPQCYIRHYAGPNKEILTLLRGIQAHSPQHNNYRKSNQSTRAKQASGKKSPNYNLLGSFFAYLVNRDLLMDHFHVLYVSRQRQRCPIAIRNVVIRENISPYKERKLVLYEHQFGCCDAKWKWNSSLFHERDKRYIAVCLYGKRKLRFA